MIACHRKHLASRCRQRGYTLEEVAGCIIREDGDRLLGDPNHPAYPREPKSGFHPPESQPVPPGPGTHLKKLLGRIGIKATPNCSCNAKARTMDAKGCDWCEEHVDQIVGWLREEAGKRRLPFVDAIGRVLVKRAISNARKEQARATETTDGESGTGSTV